MQSRKWLSYLPRTNADWLGFGFTVVMMHVIPIFELVVVLPFIDHDGTGTYWIHFSIGLFLYISVMSSFIMTIWTDTTSGSLVLPSILKPNWRFCAYCEANAPPRSFHCWSCNICVLKRDHHCMFTGNCIGYQNQRYFLIWILYLVLSALYCNYLNSDYIWEVLGGLSFVSIFTMVLPLFAWALGVSETFKFTVAFISSSCVLGFFILGVVLGYHILNVYNGQVTFERSHGIRQYDCGWKENMKVVFGQKWIISWISPLIPSLLPGNGIEFNMKKFHEDVKDM